MKQDPETTKILDEVEELALMVKGRGWGIARRKLIEKIIELGDILALDEKDPQKLMMEIAVNQQAIKVLLEWFKDIEGEAARDKSFKETFRNAKKETYLHYIS